MRVAFCVGLHAVYTAVSLPGIKLSFLIALTSIAASSYGADLKTIYSFGASNPVGVDMQHLMLGDDGRMYSATAAGAGNIPGGTIFRLDTNGANPTVVLRFSEVADSATTQERMVYGSDGALYLWAHTVGSTVGGSLIKVKRDGTGFQTLITAAQAGTRTWSELLEGSDGKLYAFAAERLVRIDRDGANFQTIHTNSATEFGSIEPAGLLEGADGKLYVLDSSGGTSGRGAIYTINKEGGVPQLLIDFATLPQSSGSTPHQLLYASDGALYGVAYNFDSSAQDLGSPIFRMQPDGTGYEVIARLEAPVLQEGKTVSALFESSDGLLYGATQNGSTNRSGMIFRLSKQGGSVTNLLAFPHSFLFLDGSVNRTPGKSLLEGIDGRLHGASGDFLFRLNHDGSNFEVTYTFPQPANEPRAPQAPVFFDSEGWLFGTTTNGGPQNAGVVYRMKPDGTAMEVLHAFGLAAQGTVPVGGVIVGSDARLYGTCYSGGASGMGTVYSLERDGSNFQVLRSFSSTGADGRFPEASLLEGSDGALYGTTYFGGGAAVGTVFKMNKDGGAYEIVHRFTNSVSGANPSSRLIEGMDGRLYGTAETNGPSGQGVVFAMNRNGTGFTLLHQFGVTGLRKPMGSLLQTSDGALYGTAAAGGLGGFGGIYRLQTDGTGYAVIRPFSATGGDGRTPLGGLTLAPDGRIYGVTTEGGATAVGSSEGGGTAFSFQPGGTDYSRVHDFGSSSPDGRFPAATMTLGPDGALYGTAMLGGLASRGVVFRMQVAPPSLWLRVNAESLILEWPASAVGYVIQTNSGAGNPGGWQHWPATISSDNGTNSAVVTPAAFPQLFFRLARPGP